MIFCVSLNVFMLFELDPRGFVVYQVKLVSFDRKAAKTSPGGGKDRIEKFGIQKRTTILIALVVKL